VPYFVIRRSGKQRIGQLNRAELDSMSRYFKDKNLFNLSMSVQTYVSEDSIEGDQFLYPGRKGLVHISTMTSKSLREARIERDPICIFKVGLVLTPVESLSYMSNISRLTSTKHKSNMLRVLHGEVYTNERLHRFGIVQSPNCDRCNEVDTLLHRLTNCEGTRQTLDELIRVTNTQRVTRNDEERLSQVLMLNGGGCLASLTLHAEILGIIVSKAVLGQDSTRTIRRVLTSLINKESNPVIKRQLKDLLQED